MSIPDELKFIIIQYITHMNFTDCMHELTGFFDLSKGDKVYRYYRFDYNIMNIGIFQYEIVDLYEKLGIKVYYSDDSNEPSYKTKFALRLAKDKYLKEHKDVSVYDINNRIYNGDGIVSFLKYLQPIDVLGYTLYMMK